MKAGVGFKVVRPGGLELPTFWFVAVRSILPNLARGVANRTDSASWGNSVQSVSVPKILTLFIPEILSHPAIAGRAKTLSVPPVGEPVGPREEDGRNVKASRSRDSTEGRSLQGGSGPSGGSVPVLC